MTAALADGMTEARVDLLAHLASLADHDAAAPCLVLPDAGWTSEEVEEQRLAARLCTDCRAVERCRAYGLTYPNEFGVYGGRTDHERRPRPGRSKTDRGDPR